MTQHHNILGFRAYFSLQQHRNTSQLSTGQTATWRTFDGSYDSLYPNVLLGLDIFHNLNVFLSVLATQPLKNRHFTKHNVRWWGFKNSGLSVFLKRAWMDVLKKINVNTKTCTIWHNFLKSLLEFWELWWKLKSSSIVFVITDYSCFCTVV